MESTDVDELMLSAAALVALGATSAMAAPAFVGNPYCEKAVSLQACGSHMDYVKEMRCRSHPDTSPSYMKNLNPHENQGLPDGGGGGGGGGGR